MNIAILLMGGSSLRTQTSIPKQYIKVANKEVFLYSFEIINKNPSIDEIYVVLNEEHKDYTKVKINEYKSIKKIFYVKPGSTRQESVFNALELIKKNNIDTSKANVIIHDSSRPMLTTKLLNDAILSLEKSPANTASIPISDSICTTFENSKIDKYLDRNKVFIIQTPQSFSFNILFEAHKKAILEHISFTDDASMVKYLGYDVNLFPGDKLNFKITTYDDLMLFKRLIGE
ncbi:MAG: 2-C-methyl-D-erythritol 4-phosphate cytidylyltransferase [Bacilli bacterium]